MAAVQTFGQFFRSRRVNLGLTLRAFCERYGYDPGNISRIERNITPPSTDIEKLRGYASALKLKEDSPEWVLFFDLAHTSKGSIPPDIARDSEILPLLPAFYRTVRGRKLNKDKIKKLVDLLFSQPRKSER